MKKTFSIANTDLLRFVTEDQEKNILAKSAVYKKSKGDAIILQGEAGLGLYVLVHGVAEVYPDRDTKAIAKFEVGTVFGEMSLLEGQKASSTVRVSSASAEIMLIPREFVLHLLDADLEFAKNFYHAVAMVLSGRLRNSNQFVADRLKSGREILHSALKETEEVVELLGSLKRSGEQKSLDLTKMVDLITQVVGLMESITAKISV